MTKLNEILSEKKLTTKWLAENTGISKKTLDDYRSGRRKEPSLSKGLKIAKALNINPYDLIQEDTE